MHESWNDTNDLNDALGDDFDVAAGWEDFNKKKEKKRPIPFWLWGTLSILGVAIIVCLFKGQQQQKSTATSTDTSLNLNSNASPSISESSTNTVGNIPFSNLAEGTNTPRKANVKTRVHRPLKHAISIEKNSTQHKSLAQHFVLVDSDKSILQYPTNLTIKEGVINKVIAEKTMQASLKSFSRKDNISFLPSVLNPLTIERIAIIPFWEYLPKSSNLPKSPSTNEKLRTYGLAYIYNRPQRILKGTDELYQNLRQDGEEFLELQQVDFTVTQPIKKNFFFNTGLSYGRYRSRLVEKIQVLQSPVVYNDVIIETQTQNNITNEIRGEAIGSQLSINESTRYQVYQTLTLPVQLGVQLPLKKDWQISLRSGIAINLWQHAKGSTYASTLPNGEFLPVTSLGYRSAGTIEHISNLQLQKKITEQLNIHFGLQTKFDLNNRIKKEIGSTDKWQNYGLSIGISRTW